MAGMTTAFAGQYCPHLLICWPQGEMARGFSMNSIGSGLSGVKRGLCEFIYVSVASTRPGWKLLEVILPKILEVFKEICTAAEGFLR
jgi:hypothetical protein